MTLNESGWYVCLVENDMGSKFGTGFVEVVTSFDDQIQDSSIFQSASATLITVVAIISGFFIILIVFCFVFYKRFGSNLDDCQL